MGEWISRLPVSPLQVGLRINLGAVCLGAVVFGIVQEFAPRSATIQVILPAASTSDPFGAELAVGIRAAQLELEDRHGTEAPSVTIEINTRNYDEERDAIAARLALAGIANPRVAIVVGGSRSDTTKAGIRFYGAAGIPVVSWATNMDPPPEGWATPVVQLLKPHEDQARVLVRYLEDKAAAHESPLRILVAHDGNVAYSESLYNHIRRELEEADLSYDDRGLVRSAGGYSYIADLVNDGLLDVVVYSGYDETALDLIGFVSSRTSAVVDATAPLEFLLTDAAFGQELRGVRTPYLLSAARPAREATDSDRQAYALERYLSALNDAFESISALPEGLPGVAARLPDDFQDFPKFGWAASAYDAVLLAAKALESTAGSGHVSLRNLAAYLSSGDLFYDGVMGRYGFNEAGRNIARGPGYVVVPATNADSRVGEPAPEEP